MSDEKNLFLEMTEPWQQDYLTKQSEGLGRAIFSEKTAPDLPPGAEESDILSVFINSKVDLRTFQKMPHLKLITTRSTGFDHIDLKEARRRNIAVANVPAYGENTVAEHTFALILSLSRNLRKAYFKMREGDFSLDGLMGFDLKGKRLGVVGTGHIGLHVIRMAKGFGMEVLAYDVKQNDFLADVLDFQYVSLDELLGASDIISLHLPYRKATHHLIHAGNVSQIKRGAILINTARGGLVETAALVKALDERILAGAGLDVLEGEELMPALKDHTLLHRDNVIFTPHMAFYSKEAVTRILEATVQSIASFRAGTCQSHKNFINAAADSR